MRICVPGHATVLTQLPDKLSTMKHIWKAVKFHLVEFSVTLM
jgi:hypothetical protein